MIPFHIAKPQGCDIQTFYGTVPNNSGVTYQHYQSWNKPVGVSHVYMMLIGGGAQGVGGTTPRGGGSGAVTVWYGAAQHVPNSLLVRAPAKNISNSKFGDTTVSIWTTANTAYDLLTATSAGGVSGAAAMSANSFAASGFFQSVAGQDGSTTTQSASAYTFLSGGSDSSSSTANYGYTGVASNGYFIMQPIIVGLGGKSTGIDGGIGCGTYRSSGYAGGGLVLIASW